MLARGLLSHICRRSPGDIWDSATQHQIKKMGITMYQNCLLNSWDSCSLTIAATMSVDSNFLRFAEIRPADVNQFPGEVNSSQFKFNPSRAPRAEDKNPPREVSRSWLNYVI
jgi:hypothetical protein